MAKPQSKILKRNSVGANGSHTQTKATQRKKQSKAERRSLTANDLMFEVWKKIHESGQNKLI